jgi:hypothetical protein
MSTNLKGTKSDKLTSVSYQYVVRWYMTGLNPDIWTNERRFNRGEILPRDQIADHAEWEIRQWEDVGLQTPITIVDVIEYQVTMVPLVEFRP